MDTPKLITLGRNQFLVICVSLVAMATLIVWALLSPAFYAFYCEHHYLPAVESSFGFHAERIALPGNEYRPLAITALAPGGPFENAGFRVGDIPVDHHGGLNRLCSALRFAESGGEAHITVVNVADRASGRARRREVGSVRK